jgi:hypothetical protein
MAFTLEQLEALKASIAAAGNAADVSYSDGARVRYLSPVEASRLLDLMTADVRSAASAAADPTARPIRAFRAQLRSGY